MRKCLAAIALLAACARTPVNRAGDHGARTGLASYYSDSLRGHKTANGDRYDPDQLTCAHRSLAFGTRVRVTVKKSGASAICTINDRGPYVQGRIVDVSHAMARALGIGAAGVAEVEIEPID